MSLSVRIRQALFAACLIAVTTPALAVNIFVNGEEMIVHGTLVDGDAEKIREAAKPGVKYIVLRNLGTTGSGKLADAMQVADAVKDAGLVTVLHGACGYACVRIFLAGRERMVSAGARLEASYLMLGGSFAGANGTASPTDYAYVSDRTDIPFGTMLSYFQRRDRKLMIFHPKAQTSKGSVLGCQETVAVPDCERLDSFDALSARIITTADLYESANTKEGSDLKPPAASNFAALADEPPIATLSDNCRAKYYQRFLTYDKPRAFVVSKNNGCYMAPAQRLQPLRVAMDDCVKAQRNNAQACRFYAVDDDVVFKPF
ncbi:hypothetical protein [Uliginosibacterium sp. H1]|uniref:hypothetical protein n=1 Tax=Uliginosibacterium sp. H1 TaxID=3114757 RepID=UPI002E176D96|nr:hypothetical protein [Uliginosibacterium sp. H1]